MNGCKIFTIFLTACCLLLTKYLVYCSFADENHKSEESNGDKVTILSVETSTIAGIGESSKGHRLIIRDDSKEPAEIHLSWEIGSVRGNSGKQRKSGVFESDPDTPLPDEQNTEVRNEETSMNLPFEDGDVSEMDEWPVRSGGLSVYSFQRNPNSNGPRKQWISAPKGANLRQGNHMNGQEDLDPHFKQHNDYDALIRRVADLPEPRDKKRLGYMIPATYVGSLQNHPQKEDSTELRKSAGADDYWRSMTLAKKRLSGIVSESADTEMSPDPNSDNDYHITFGGLGHSRPELSKKVAIPKVVPKFSTHVHIKGPIINRFPDNLPRRKSQPDDSRTMIIDTGDRKLKEKKENTKRSRDLLRSLLRDILDLKSKHDRSSHSTEIKPDYHISHPGYRSPDEVMDEEEDDNEDLQPANDIDAESTDNGVDARNDDNSHGVFVEAGCLGNITIKPNPSCFKYEKRTHTCWIKRQIGSSLNIEPRIYNHKGKEIDPEDLEIEWFRTHRTLNHSKIVSHEITDDVTQPNLFIGDDGRVLRVSPLREKDMDFNGFKFVVRADPASCKNGTIPKILAKMAYRILIIPVDMGTLYQGEDLTIDIRSYITLPPRDLRFQWFVERGLHKRSSLPPNMVVTDSGRSLSITELPPGKTWTIVCAMYDKASGMFVAKRRFWFSRPMHVR